MVILGIDPGFATTGYGLIEVDFPSAPKPRLIEAGVLKSNRAKALNLRLFEIHQQLMEIFDEFSPQAVAVEDIYSSPGFPKSGILIGHVRGVVLLAAAQKTVPVFSYYPIQVKKSLVGNGTATKSQVQKMVQTTLSFDPCAPDDLSDALAIALCHAGRSRDFKQMSLR